jgi:hypothetical protein
VEVLDWKDFILFELYDSLNHDQASFNEILKESYLKLWKSKS